MRDEGRFPTMRFLTCRACGQAYTASLTGVDTCPRCQAPAHPSDTRDERISKVIEDGHWLFTISGPMYKIKDLEELKIHLDEALRGDPESLAFRFERVSYLESSMLAQLVRAVHELTRRGKPVYVITGDAQVVESLQILDLDRVMTLLPSLEAYRTALALKGS